MIGRFNIKSYVLFCVHVIVYRDAIVLSEWKQVVELYEASQTCWKILCLSTKVSYD